MKRFCFICIFLSGCFFSKAQIIERADSLFVNEDFLSAALWYERQAFEVSDSREKGAILMKKSFCYKAMGNYAAALKILSRVVAFPQDSIYDLLVYEKALLSYLNEDYESSYNEILRHSLVRGSLSADLIVIQAFDLVSMNKWEEAKSLLVKNQDMLGLTDKEIHDVFHKRLKPKSPDKAFTLSMFLPGVGQMYAGYFFKGMVSGGIQATLIAFSAYGLYKGYFFTGGLTGVALFYTFYFGGARHAKELAIRKNTETAAKINREVQNLILGK